MLPTGWVLFLLSLATTEPSGPARVRAAIEPAEVVAGETIELRIEVLLGAGWILYGLSQGTESVTSTSIVLDRTQGATPLGDYVAPPADESPDPTEEHRIARTHSTSVTFTRRIKIEADAPTGPLVIAGRIDLVLRQPMTGRKLSLKKYPFRAHVKVLASIRSPSNAALPRHRVPEPISPTAIPAVAPISSPVKRMVEPVVDEIHVDPPAIQGKKRTSGWSIGGMVVLLFIGGTAVRLLVRR